MLNFISMNILEIVVSHVDKASLPISAGPGPPDLKIFGIVSPLLGRNSPRTGAPSFSGPDRPAPKFSAAGATAPYLPAPFCAALGWFCLAQAQFCMPVVLELYYISLLYFIT